MINYRMAYRMRIFECPKCKAQLEVPTNLGSSHALPNVVCKTDKTKLSAMRVVSDKNYKISKEVSDFSDKTSDGEVEL